MSRPRRQARASIARRIGVAVAVVVALLLAVLGTTIWGMLQLSDVNQRIQQTDLPLQRDSPALLTALVNEETGLRGYVLSHNVSLLQPLKDGQSSYTQLVRDIERLSANADVEAGLHIVETRVTAWRMEYEQPELEAVLEDSAAQEAGDAVRGAAFFDQIRSALTQLSTSISSLTAEDFAAATAIRGRILFGVVGAAAFGTALGIAVLLLSARTILRPLASLREVARAMNEGRPAGSAPRPAPPELRDVYDAMVDAAAALQERETALASANEELAQASHSKSEFLATMSHELRTPLNAILGFTDLVRSGATGQVTPQTDDYLERVRRNGAILLELINDVLDLSKIEAGRMPVNLEVVDVDRTVRQVVANVQSLTESGGTTLEVRANAGGETLAVADPRALNQILTNLIGNAVKFTVEGSVCVEIREDHGLTLVDIADTGPGIVPEDQTAIFEPFRQVGAHARTGTGGTGLGLAISVRLARLMRGDITLISQPGEGSRFTLRLPAARGKQVELSNGRRDGPIVLAVDDDVDALSLWQAQLERLGFGFVGIQDSSSAVTVAAALKPVAILLDIVFPEASGWDVLEELQRDPRTAGIPVVVVSVVDREDHAHATTVRFLQKPASEEQLRAELEPYLRVPVEALA